ncbi:hypothetical protein [Ilumatobacter sp.]|uniref:hypothetical protein n=1 Tax=Ilumatobacter sp. TaxID=1967498 RepID=UPI003AF788E2
MSRTPGPDPTSAAAELHVIADTVDRQRDRVGGLAEPFLGTEREDVVATVHEAERQLHIAARAIRRAIKTLEQ